MLYKLGRLILLTGIQILAFVALYESGFRLFAPTPVRRDIAYGIGLHYGLILFSGLAILNSIAQISKLNTGGKVISTSLCFIAFFYYWSPSISYTPYRAALVLTAGLAGLLLGLILNQILPTGKFHHSSSH